ncbi:MAG: molybdopterin-dependent oxidoreductase, partial [Candidatus Kapaibacteriota bacterium]
MKIQRRDFLKALGIGGVGTALLANSVVRVFSQNKTKELILQDVGKWIPSTCQGCTTWCPIEVFVINGRAVKVRGNHRSKVNPGYVCPRGHFIPIINYDPDRVKVPLKRTNPLKGRGIDPQFVPITWDEALEIIADKIMELRSNGEIHKLMFLRGRYTPVLTNIVYSSLPKILGTPNSFSHSSICAEAEKSGPFFTEGYWGYRDYDIMNSKYIVLWGVDPVRSNRLVPGMINKWGKIVEKAKVVTIDPILTTAASKSHEWLPIIPGQDGALAVAFAHVILTEGLWNKEFVGDFKDGVNRFVPNQIVSEDDFQENYTYGLVKWWNIELKDKTPEWAEPITGISKEKIVQIAKEMGKAAPRVIHWLGPGPAMSPRGSYTAMVIHALNGLLGSADNEGGTLRGPSYKVASTPAVDNYLDDIAKTGNSQKKIDGRGDIDMPAMASGKVGSGVVTANIANNILKDKPYEIKMAIGYWCNFNFSVAGAQRWDEAIKKIPFFVHCVTHASEMTMFADIVLPSTFHATEQWSIVESKGNLHSNVSIQQPLARRLFDVKDYETEVVWLLAEKLKAKGFSNLYDYFYNEFANPETGEKPRNAEEFALFATMKYAKPAYDLIGGWEKFLEEGVVNFGPYNFRSKWQDFGTPTKKFEFYSESMKKAWNDHATKYNKTIDEVLEICNYAARGETAFVPHYEPPIRKGDSGEYPLIFIDAKSRLNREGRSQNISWYYEFKIVDPGDENMKDVTKINPVDAEKLGLKDGDKIRLVTV